MSSLSPSTTGEGHTLTSPAGVFASVLSTAVTVAVAKLEHKVAAWTDKLNGVADDAESGGGVASLADEGLDELGEAGTAQKAGTEVVKAGLHGKNPVWAAVKGAWHSGSPAVKAAIITAAVSAILLLVLSPVLLILLLLSLLVLWGIQRARNGRT